MQTSASRSVPRAGPAAARPMLRHQNDTSPLITTATVPVVSSAATTGSPRSPRSSPGAGPAPGRRPPVTARSGRPPRGRPGSSNSHSRSSGRRDHPCVAQNRCTATASCRGSHSRNHAAVRRAGRVDVDDEGGTSPADQPVELAQPRFAARPEEVRPPRLRHVDARVREGHPLGRPGEDLHVGQRRRPPPGQGEERRMRLDADDPLGSLGQPGEVEARAASDVEHRARPASPGSPPSRRRSRAPGSTARFSTS